MRFTRWYLAHPLRRCHQLISDAVAGQAKTPHALPRLFEHAAGGPRRRQLGCGPLGAEVAVLEATVDRLVAGAIRYPPNRRLLDRLARERTHLFTFLRVPGVPATNWRAEQAHASTWPSPAPIGIPRPPRAHTLWKRRLMPLPGPRS